jgi:hypothetical protein
LASFARANYFCRPAKGIPIMCEQVERERERGEGEERKMNSVL